MAVLPLSSIPTISDLYKNGLLQPVSTESHSNQPSPSAALNNKISLIRTSITTLATTSIVNAANKSLLGGGGVDGAIHAAAGPSLYDECETLNGCATGFAKITSGYELPAKYVIHAVGPIYARERRISPSRPGELLTSCYKSSLDLAAQKGGSVAFSCLSTGVYGYPPGEAAQVAIKEVKRWLEEGGQEKLERVVFCCFEPKDERAYQEWLPKLFPPHPSNLPSSSQSIKISDSSSGAENTNPSLNTSGPVSKKQKTDSEELDKSWEAVEKHSVAQPEKPTDLDEEGEKVEKPVVTPLDKSTDLSEEGEKLEAPASEKGTDLTDEGEKVEVPDLSKDDGEKVEKPDLEGPAGGSFAKTGLLKDW